MTARTTATAAKALTTEQVGEMMKLLKGADTAELKLTIPPTAHRATITGLGVDPVEAQPRQVYFFDTPDLALDAAGVVVRARRIQGGRADTVIKLRPVMPDDLDAELRKSGALSVEVDAIPGGFVCSASFKGRSTGEQVRAAVAGEIPIRKMFSKEQRAFFADHAPAGVDLDALVTLGPTFILKGAFIPKGIDRRLVAEMWLYPDGSRLLELSTKCLPGEAFQVAAEFRVYLGGIGVEISGAQQTKTRAALEYFAAQARQELTAGTPTTKRAPAKRTPTTRPPQLADESRGLRPDRPDGGRSGPSSRAGATEDAAVAPAIDLRLGLLLAAAMFVLVVDTSLMNVSISAVVADLGTTVSGVQSAIALEALVSAAFILISSKVGDLIGRKRAYVLGLLGYAIGALAMVLAQDLLAIIIFWAICGGLGASLLLPSMQSLIHGNFEGDAQKRVYALVGASAAIAAAVGPLIGGFITTFLSWRVGFLMELGIVALVLLGIGLVKDVPYAGPRGIDLVGAAFSVVGMGGVVLGILVWQEGGEAVLAFIVVGAASLGALAWWLVRGKRAGTITLLDPDLFRAKLFRLGISGQLLQQIALGGLMIALPIFLQMVLEYNALESGLSIAPLSLSMFVVALLAGKRAGKGRPAGIIRIGFLLLTIGVAAMLPLVPRVEAGWWLAVPLLVAGSGLGLLVSQLNNYTLSPISEERISEAAGVNSAGGSFGLSFGLAFAGGIMLATLAFTFTAMVDASPVIPPDDKQQIADVLEDDAQLMSNTQLTVLLADEPPDVATEVVRINTEARPIALQVALLVPLLAGLLGFLNSFRMLRLPDPAPSAAAESMLMG